MAASRKSAKTSLKVVPKVVIDARMVGPIPHGFARYVTRLADGLARLKSARGIGYEPVFLTGRDFPDEDFFGFRTVPLRASFLNPRELWEIPRVLSAEGAALYHSPTFSSLFLCPCPWIVTVHDLNHLTYGGSRERIYYQALLKPFMRKARALCTVSEFSRREIARWSGIPESGIEVVHNALEPGLLLAPAEDEIVRVLARFGLKRGKYFFCLSNPKPHKNVSALVEAYRRFRSAHLSLAPGSPPWDLAISFKAPEDVAGVRALGGVGEREAHVLLWAAGAVAFPSLYEGFGLPPMEAASIGKPVLVSAIPPHHEALCDVQEGEAAWVEPADLDGWTRALEVAQQGGVREPAESTQVAIRDRYSTERIGERMHRIYQKCLES